VENYYGANYWTEKIADCWLAGTLPFYFGCPNLEKYFPAKSFIRIDLNDVDSAARIIRRMVDAGEYEKRLPAIREARDLLLTRHQFFPFIAKELRDNLKRSSAAPIYLSSYRQSPISRLRCLFFQRLHQFKVRGFS
jgi:Arc/MetJ-type ribon-helix-helix transcriptional regulator